MSAAGLTERQLKLYASAGTLEASALSQVTAPLLLLAVVVVQWTQPNGQSEDLLCCQASAPAALLQLSELHRQMRSCPQLQALPASFLLRG